MPEGAVATPAAPAPAAAAPAAAAPAPVAPAAPAAPAPPAPPAAGGPAAAPEAPAAGAPPAAAAPVAPAAPQGPPKASDYPNTEEGVEKFIEDSEKFRAEHPEEADAAAAQARKDAEAAQPGAQPKDERVAQPEAPKPPEPAAEAKPAAAATPKALDDLFNAKPALKAAFDADPEAKAVLMETARFAEAARPVLDMLPTVEEARAVTEASSTFWNIQHGLAMAQENPEAGDRAFNQLVDLFTLRDDKGQPMVKDGAPVMAESFDFLTQRITTGALTGVAGQAKAELAALENRVKTGVYPSEAAKEADRVAAVDLDYKIKAFEYVAEILKADESLPDLPSLPEGATQAQREYQQRLEAERGELEKTRGQNKKADRVKARQGLELRVNQDYGAGVGKFIDNELKARKERGEFIPDFVLERKYIDPKTNQETAHRDFGVRVMSRLTAKIWGIPSVAEKLRNLEMQGAPAEQARKDYLNEQRAKYLPAIFNEEFDSIYKSIRGMADQSHTHQQEVAKVARVEPATGGAPTAASPMQALSAQAAMQKAQENLANNAEYKAASRSEKLEMEIVEAERLRAGR